MLADIVEKAERTAGGVTTKTGSCKFCKQAAMRKVLCEWNQEEIDELATETCECVNARIYTHKKSQKERAHNKIDLLFGENNTTVIVPDAAVDLLHKTVYPICEGFIQSATVDMGNGIKGKISITTKGIVKVTRTKDQYKHIRGIGGNMKEKTKAFYKAVFKYWLHERKESVKRLFVRRTK